MAAITTRRGPQRTLAVPAICAPMIEATTLILMTIPIRRTSMPFWRRIKLKTAPTPMVPEFQRKLMPSIVR
jgi:hypothetical protein